MTFRASSLIFIFYLVLSGYAQDPKKPKVIGAVSVKATESILVDKFQNATCEELWARLDNFRNALGNNPEAFATVVMAGKLGQIRDDLWIEDMIRGYFLRTTERWKIVRTQPQAERTIEFWITPPGAEAPKTVTAEWSLVYPKETKPFIFTYEPDHMEEVTVCLVSNRLRLLAQVLHANPTARTNVVLIVRPRNNFVRRRRHIIAELVKDYGIRRQQIKIFKQITHRRDPFHIEPEVEYWLVP